MAKVTQPLGSSEARGALGGLVYNSWRGMSTVRTRVTPVKENETAQLALRALTKNCTLQWQGLTDAVRSTWQKYALQHLDSDWTGNPKRLSGYNWYVRINVRRQLIGQAISDTIPTYSLSWAINGLVAYKSGDHFIISYNYTSYTGSGTLYYEYYAAGPYTPARNPTVKEAIRIGYATNNAGQLNWIPPSVGTYHFFVRPILSNGIVGHWARCSGVFS